ncbi:threonine/serine dehydratase [Parvularcula sp. LCG005]|uniref:threonine ammonia-lyase n=1 Tax=Parvularcula sp. LCG005 TaxID=3078805 RepID=UPI0029435764|nr:threonine/serine dehydratase [Parvularcula sp. LCG005]WOI53208.1 threonine/serine dehydratase [Parvularcula sp. LCG005]
MQKTASVTIDDIHAAADRLRPHLTPTPLLRSPLLDLRCRGEVFLKAECLQQTGSFKIRGALNRVLQLTEREKAAGVVAYSSGNHAQGVALAARMAGVEATIVMPEDAPQVKRDRTRRLGAEIVTYDRLNESREEIAGRLAAEKGAVLIPPFDDPHVIAGQGTVGLEIAETTQRLGVELDQILVCCSGGGLAAGIGMAMAAEHPGARLFTVEPKGFDDVRRSLVSGGRLANPPGGTSVCDALLVSTSGQITFPLLKSLKAEGLAVSDQEAMAAIRFAAEELKVILEPGGAVALAAILYGHVATKGLRTAVVLSGGNVDRAVFDRAMRYAV